MERGLVYIGKVVSLAPIEKADRIELATVVCGEGGKWSGVVRKGEFSEGSACQIYLQDSLLPERPEFEFLRDAKFRVRMRRFRGAPSEALIMPQTIDGNLGDNVTDKAGVEKYEKPLPLGIGGDVLGNFPSLIPKTDEPNFQGVPELVAALRGKPFYSTVKVDGTSSTAFRYAGHFGVCGRNYEYKESDSNAMWTIAKEYKLPEVLADGYAIQWETVGPGIQKNPLGLKKVEPRAFQVYSMEGRRYLDFREMTAFLADYEFPMVDVIDKNTLFLSGERIQPLSDEEYLRKYAEGVYPNGGQREGVVIRPLTEERVGGVRLSFKVVNLLYRG